MGIADPYAPASALPSHSIRTVNKIQRTQGAESCGGEKPIAVASNPPFAKTRLSSPMIK